MAEMIGDNKNVYQRLLEVQKEARAPRSVDGRFGKARSAEGILEAYKPICNEHGLFLMTSDVIHTEGDRNYILSTATVINVHNPQEQVSANAEAWEGNVVSGLDTSQVSGKTSSYAKKYALQNLFAIDDTKDADVEHTDPEDTPIPVEKRNLSAKEKTEDRAKSFLDGRKIKINASLVEHGYDTVAAKMAFVKSVLGKETIENGSDANEIEEALRIESEESEIQDS
jgi:hypothetical protein